jgi:mRNA interferase YafQ
MAMGLTVSDAPRIMLLRIAKEKTLPFEPLIPNDETIAAMKESRKADFHLSIARRHCWLIYMRTIERTGTFKCDYKREAKGPHRTTLATNLIETVLALANDQLLPDRYYDHALAGDWKDHRDCHIKPDLVMIY